MPALCAILAWQCAELWDQNKVLRANVGRFEADAQLAQARAERLAYLEELLNQASVPARDIILRRLASGNAPPQEVAPETAEPNLHEEGPGHEEFTVLDNGRVKISNVQVKRVGSNGLRIGLDLRNPDNEKMLAGEISVTLLTADGQKIPLIFDPLESGSFRINRFKRATMISHPGRNISLGNSQVIVEVKDARIRRFIEMFMPFSNNKLFPFTCISKTKFRRQPESRPRQGTNPCPLSRRPQP